MRAPRISVTHEHDAHYHVRIRQHGIVVDQPVPAGGLDLGPTPTELFVGSLAACAAFYVGSYLQRHGSPTNGFHVDCDFEMSDGRPSRVTSIRLEIVLPDGVSSARRKAALRVAERCTVHNSIRMDPEITIALREGERAA